MDKVKPTIDEVQIVITAPSRELANQIYQEAQRTGSFQSTRNSRVKFCWRNR